MNNVPDLEGVEFIKAFSEINFVSDAQALGVSIMQARDVKQAMEDFNWQLLEHVVAKFGQPAEKIHEAVVTTLNIDQRVQAIQPVLRKASSDCTGLLTQNSAPPVDPSPTPTKDAAGVSMVFQKTEKALTNVAAAKILEQASKKLEEHNDKKVDVQILISTSDD